MTLDDLAALHARAFTTHPPPWSAAALGDMLATSGAFLLTRPAGFLVGRVIADEAELLTLAVAPEARRQGTGRALVAGFLAAARARGAARAYLEVAADNPGALALYRATGWAEAGLRRNYYAPGVDGRIMTHDLTF